MRTLVIGAGIVGTTTAYYLAKLGHEVEVVDRQPDVALETSFANGGVLHAGDCEPWSQPGMVRNALRWFGKEDAPLLLRPSALPRMWRWGLAFARNCAPERFHRNTMANLRLSLLTLQEIAEVRAEAGMNYDLRQTGMLRVFRRQDTLDAKAAECAGWGDLGPAFEVLDATETVRREPALASQHNRLAGALHFTADETGDCRMFTQGLRDHCTKLGVRFRFGMSVDALERSGNRVSGVRTADGERIAADNVVVAAATGAPALLRPHGVKLPIYPVKGVTITVSGVPWDGRPKIPVIDDSGMFVLTPLGVRLRVAGSAEIAGTDITPSPARCKAIVDRVLRVFPDFATCYDPDTASLWAGLRPMTPTGTPCLGATRIPNLFVNAGHGHLGWTMSCGSARVVANIVDGRDPGIDMDRLALDQR